MNLLLVSLGLGALSEAIPPPRMIGFIPTAGEPYADPYFVRDDRARLVRLGYSVQDIDISNASLQRTLEQLDAIDALFIAGGNTFYLMQQIRERGLVDAIHKFVSSGRFYIGASAGAAICGPSIEPFRDLDDAGAAPKLRTLAGLELTHFVVLPHYGNPKYLEKYQKIQTRYQDRFGVVFLKDDEALRVTSAEHFELIPSALVFHDPK